MLALLGVVIGGLLTAGVTALLDWIKLRREARAAAMLLADDLREADAFLDISTALGVWAEVPKDVLSVERWHEHRGTVARVKFRPWYPTTTAYQALRHLVRNADQCGVAKGSPMPDHESGFGGVVELAMLSVAVAVKALDEFASQPAYRERKPATDERMDADED